MEPTHDLTYPFNVRHATGVYPVFTTAQLRTMLKSNILTLCTETYPNEVLSVKHVDPLTSKETTFKVLLKDFVKAVGEPPQVKKTPILPPSKEATNFIELAKLLGLNPVTDREAVINQAIDVALLISEEQADWPELYNFVERMHYSISEIGLPDTHEAICSREDLEKYIQEVVKANPDSFLLRKILSHASSMLETIMHKTFAYCQNRNMTEEFAKNLEDYLAEVANYLWIVPTVARAIAEIYKDQK